MNNPRETNAVNIIVEKLLPILEERKLTERDLSKLSGIPYSTIKSIFQRKTKKIYYETILQICDGLSIKPWEFIKDERLTASYLDL